jgi:hypothetical protein
MIKFYNIKNEQPDWQKRRYIIANRKLANVIWDNHKIGGFTVESRFVGKQINLAKVTFNSDGSFSYDHIRSLQDNFNGNTYKPGFISYLDPGFYLMYFDDGSDRYISDLIEIRDVFDIPARAFYLVDNAGDYLINDTNDKLVAYVDVNI